MPQLIQSLWHSLIFKDGVLPYNSGLLSAEYTMVANGYTTLNLQFREFASQIDIGDDVVFKINTKDRIGNSDTTTGKMFIQGYSIDNNFASIQCVSHNPTLFTYAPGDEWTDVTLKSIVDAAAAEQSLQSVVSASANSIIIGVAQNPAEDTVSRLDASDTILDTLLAIAPLYGYYAFVANGKLYALEFEEAGYNVSGSILNVALKDCLSASVNKNYVRANRFLTQILYQPNTYLSTYEATWVDTRKKVSFRNEGYYKDQYTARRRMNGAVLANVQQNWEFSIKVEGSYFYSAMTPVMIVNLTDGFLDTHKGKYVIDRIVHRYSSNSGWTIEFRGQRRFDFPY